MLQTKLLINMTYQVSLVLGYITSKSSTIIDLSLMPFDTLYFNEIVNFLIATLKICLKTKYSNFADYLKLHGSAV